MKIKNMRYILKDAASLFKIFIGGIALFLILFGIHWIAIISGLILGGLYLLIPRK